MVTKTTLSIEVQHLAVYGAVHDVTAVLRSTISAVGAAVVKEREAMRATSW